jgi:hypothetical protein
METMLEKGYNLTVKAVIAWMFLGLLLLGCNTSLEVEEGIMSREAFLEVMVDVQLLESAFKNKVFRNDNEDEVLERAYVAIFEKHEVTAEEFNLSHTWWWSHPEEVKAILIQVTERLNEIETQANEAK